MTPMTTDSLNPWSSVVIRVIRGSSSSHLFAFDYGSLPDSPPTLHPFSAPSAPPRFAPHLLGASLATSAPWRFPEPVTAGHVSVRCSLFPVCHSRFPIPYPRCITTIFSSVISRTAYFGPSFPSPLCFSPP